MKILFSLLAFLFILDNLLISCKVLIINTN